ncbi:nuclear transport factor 2 family protein [Streptomyces chattanoogensis]|uniref:SnoaL-like domain-containing protein n=1 Tax=Streptomyces chattanoogensis TaxID=66876 RepID=A0A0N0H002_9ACTN|nr:nuclear transport factor 2 family protein [Streptomyces chattanoogensis]AJT66497.1 hypothetical protein T261_4859 [Streptomyces lydicus]KPC63199.1 hypothetical protein ADL29_15930 [Streptomyces chattanoogensis]
MPTLPLPAPVESALRAANSDDVEGFLALFTEDGVVTDWGREFRGRDGIREWCKAEFIGRKVTLEPMAVWREGHKATVSLRVGGSSDTGPSDIAFTLEGDRIARMELIG